MKKLVLTLLVVLLLVICACKNTEMPDDKEQHTPPVSDEQDATLSPKDDIPPADVPPIDPPQADTDNSYTLAIPAYVNIYNVPSYDGYPVCAVGTDGTYTIVEDKPDGEGNLWGKLKSGIGWVDLNYIEQITAVPPILTANFAEPALIGENGCYEYLSGAPEVASRIVFLAHSELSDVKLTSMFWGENGYEVDKELYTIDKLTPQKPLVAELIFAGNATIFGISCRDENGLEHTFALTVNGRNGTFDMHEYTK